MLNTAVSFGEVGAAVYSGSLSLLVDSAHNLSDELALYLATPEGRFHLWYAERDRRRAA